LRSAGRTAAINALKEAARRAPSQPEIWSNLAAAELLLGRHADADASARRAIAVDARYASGWYNLALVLEPQGRVLEALDAASRASALAPDAMAHAGLKAQLQADLGQLDAARTTLEAALARAPTAAALHSQLARVAEELDDFTGAMRALEHVVRLDPKNGAALSQLLFLRKRVCDWHDLPALREQFQAGVAAGRSWLTPFSLLSDPSTRAQQLACSKTWSAQFAAQPSKVRPRLTLSADRLRIGYLSADFFDHPTAVLTAGLFEQHDRARFNIIGYSTGPDDGSPMRSRIAAAFDRFVDARDWPPERLAAQIRADHVDILVDLKGHTAGAPTAALALRSAPIQVHYLGYPGTLGAAYVDYLIGDRIVTPLEHTADYSETLVQLPGSYQVNDRRRAPSAPLPREVLGLPAHALVLCCFNNTFKLNPDVADAWARILRAQPDSVLWLLARGERDPAIANLRREFADRGVESSRLVFALHRAHDDYLALYHHADLFSTRGRTTRIRRPAMRSGADARS
jgi:predicted O-linked N-acetylglucosamine transferase (SPINDLY family)